MILTIMSSVLGMVVTAVSLLAKMAPHILVASMVAVTVNVWIQMQLMMLAQDVLTDIWKIARVMVTALPSHGLVMVFATVQMKHMAWICYATRMMGAIVE